MAGNVYDDLLDQESSTPSPTPVSQPTQPADIDTLVNDHVSATRAPVANFRASLTNAYNTSPDKQAEANNISKQLNVSPDTVMANPDEMKRKAAASSFDFNKYAELYPQSAALLSDLSIAKVAHDDTENVGLLERSFKAFGASAAQGTAGLVSSLYQLPETAARITGAASQVLEDTTGLSPVLNPIRGVQDIFEFAARGELPTGQTPLPNFNFNAAAASVQQSADQMAAGSETFQRVAAKNQFGDEALQEALAGDFTKLGQVVTDPEAWATFIGNAAPSLAAVMATGGSLPVAATLEGLDTASNALQFEQKTGIKINDTQFTQAVLQAGLINGLLEKAGVESVLGAPGKGIKGVLHAMFGEGVTEGLQQFNSNLATRLAYDPTQPLGQGIIPSVLGGAGSGGAVGATGNAINYAAARTEANRLRVEQANKTAENLTNLNGVISASKVRARSPETFARMVEGMTAESPDQQIFIDPNGLNQSGVDLAELAKISPSFAEQYQDASRSGGLVSIPVTEFASKVLGTDLSQSLIDHVKTDPNGLTPAEADEFMKTQGQNFEAEVNKVLEEKQGDENVKAGIQAVHGDILGKLNATQRFTPEVNQKYATLLSSFYGAYGARNGLTPEQFAAKVPLNIQAQSPVGPQLDKELNQSEAAADVNDLGFFPKIGRVAEAKLPNKGTGKQMLENLEAYARNGDIKAEELEWSGIREYLGNGKDFTKQDVVDFLNNGGVQIEEVTLGNQQTLNLTQEDFTEDDFDPDDEPDLEQRYSLNIADGVEIESATIDKFADDKYWVTIDGNSTGRSYGTMAQAIKAIEEKVTRETGTTFGDTEAEGTKFGEYALPGGENYREVLLTLPPSNFEKPDADGQVPFSERYKSAHFDQENILAHFRLNDRQDAEGKKVLFIEEIQSDWHQAGRKKGYAPDVEKRLDDLNRRIRVIELKGQEATTEEKQEWADLMNERQPLLQSSGVPDAPFKKTWHELAFKRILAMAAEQGYDRVAWTTGEQQTDRFNLGRQVKSIAVPMVNENGTRSVRIDPNEGTTLNMMVDKQGIVEGYHSANQFSGKPLDEVVGKDLAQKIMALKVPETFAGEGLKVGGEGMKGFYDSILPKAVQKIVGKHDKSVKVGTSTLNTTNEDIESPRISLFNSGEARVEYNGESHDFDTEAEADAYVKSLTEGMESTKVHSVDITPALRESVAKGQELFQDTGARRGSFSPATSTISLLAKSDLSTFLHETGHFFLETLNSLAKEENAPQQIKDDMNAVLRWFGVKAQDGKTALERWNSFDLEQQRKYHEQFARGFEAYLFEGKAPSVELREVFSRFRAWLLNIYRSMINLNVELSDGVRSVFDRMLATDEQIREAQAIRELQPMFKSAEEAQMTADQFRAYQALGEEATQTAVDNLQTRSLRDMKWLSNAKDRVIKDLQAQANSKRKDIAREVTSEVMAEPVNQARQFLRFGTQANGEKTEGVHRLDIDALKEGYKGWEELESKYGKYGMLGKDGVNPEVAAEMFGYSSGEALINDLLTAEDAKTKIRALTDQRMLERHGDLVEPRAIAEAADAAIHNEARTKFVASEMNALQQALGKRKILASAAKDFAEMTVARVKIRDLKPSRYASAEAKAARRSDQARKAGDIQAAATEKRNQLIQSYATQAAYKAQDEIEKGLAYFKKFDRDSTRKNLDPEYTDQIDALLERFDLRKGITLKALARRASLADWAAKQQDIGVEPEISPNMLNDAYRKHYKDMAVEEFRGLQDAVKQIEHLGRLKNRLLTAKDARDFKATVEALVQSIRDKAKGKVYNNITPDDFRGNARQLISSYFASLRGISDLSRELDGFETDGLMWNTFIRPMNEARNKEATMRADATKKLAEILAPVMAQGSLGKKTYFPSIERSLSKRQALGMALNIGNPGNYQRLLDGEGWNAAQIAPVLDTLTKEDWDFVQKTWDFIESYRPQIAAKERRVTGREPQWVEPMPVNTKFGEYRGGYYPVVYDSRRSIRAEQYADAEAARQQLRGAFTSATTRRSFTKTRAEEVKGRPLLLNLENVFKGTNEIIHDLSWHEWLIDANRLIRNKSLDGAIRTHKGADVSQQFKTALTDIAGGEGYAGDAMEKAVNHLRTGAVISGLAFNIANSLINVSGLSQSVVRVRPKYMMVGVGAWARSPVGLVQSVWAKSDLMRVRSTTMMREINELRATIHGKSQTRRLAEAVLQSPLTATQLAVDMPTWWGEYQKAKDNGETEDKAVALADQAVIDTQGGGATSDLPAVMRGNGYKKLLTVFYGFFSRTYNLAVESTKKTNFTDPLDVIRLGGDYMLLYAIPALWSTVIKGVLFGNDDDKDIEQLEKIAASEGVSTFLGQFVGIRELTGGIQKMLGTSQYNLGYAGPAGMRFFAEFDKLSTQIKQEELDKALTRSAINIGGILFHLPSTQVNRTIDGIAAVAEGNTNNPLAVVGGAH